MKQKNTSKRSSSSVESCTTSNRSNTNDSNDLNKKNYLGNEKKNAHLCEQCQKDISNNLTQELFIRCTLCNWDGYLSEYELHLDLCHSSWPCNYDDELCFYCCICEESIVEKSSKALHISLRLSPVHSKSVLHQTSNVAEKVNNLTKDLATANDNIQKLTSELICQKNSLYRLSQECSSLQMNFQEQNASISKIKSEQDMSEENLAKIQQAMADLHYATYDGSFVWKITNVAEKRSKAHSGEKPWFVSPAFYSSPSGYKMRARLYPYGDGDARSTHMSLYLVIFKGEFDAILPWPFNFPVTFCLFDQTGENHHTVDSFYPNTTSTSFQRPKSEMNIGSGIQKFCPLMIFELEGNRYVRDDTMFIKIKLDFVGTPKEILPYTLSLNPGLPTHMQEVMLQIKTEQHNQVRAALIAEITRENQEMSQSAQIPMCLP